MVKPPRPRPVARQRTSRSIVRFFIGTYSATGSFVGSMVAQKTSCAVPRRHEVTATTSHRAGWYDCNNERSNVASGRDGLISRKKNVGSSREVSTIATNEPKRRGRSLIGFRNTCETSNVKHCVIRRAIVLTIHLTELLRTEYRPSVSRRDTSISR